MNAQVEQFIRNIQEKLPTHASAESAAEKIKTEFENMVGVPPGAEMLANLATALDAVNASLQKVEILRRLSITKVHETWYTGGNAHDRHWPALRGYLENEKGWDKETLTSIDTSSTEVVSLLANPMKDQFRCRGLVVGYVQSGKTANMTAVIAKAVDAGYNLIVLLAGVTNKLRAQTQRRLEQDIVSRHSELWQLYTTDEDKGDFTAPNNRSFTMPVDGRAQLIVMKKVTSRLAAFLKTIKKSPKILRSLKILIIDDECDQASVNSSSDEYNMTKINEKIRQILEELPAVSYVGYTATPFANVFINPFPHNKDTLDDLYPEDFITALPRPKDYFGAKEVFGSPPDDAESETDNEAGLDMVRTIPAGSVGKLQPPTLKSKDGFFPQLTPDLEDAISWYLLTCAIRRRRNQSGSHMTMLIHTSPFVIQHKRMAEIVQNWVDVSKKDIMAGRGDVFTRMKSLWDEEVERMPLDTRWPALNGPGDLLPELNEVLNHLELAIENGESFTRLDYTGGAKTYIVVGGSVLARGLTLEGLSVSYFLRTAKQYDTLLQMGRWFGYRHGYGDLPRLWTTAGLESDFRALAQIEEEIREDIATYRSTDATPLEFAVKVRSIPGMAITSASKMKHAHRTNISFEGRHVQTIRFDHRKSEIVAANWKAAARLTDAMRPNIDPGVSSGRLLARDVSFQHVRRFLTEYSICEHHMDLKKQMLLGYLDKAADALKYWNVGIISPEKGVLSADDLGFLGRVHTNNRARLQSAGRPYADIKALMSKRDILIDAPAGIKGPDESWDALKDVRPNVPLLLLYPINSLSPSSRKTREPLNAVGDLIGFGIVFPGSKDHAGDYYAVELEIPAMEQIDEEDPELDDELELLDD